MRDKILIQTLDVSINIKNKEDALNECKMRQFIDELIVCLNMTVLIPTLVVKVPIVNYQDIRGNKVRPDDLGITGLTAIAESHIAFHTFPNEGIILIQISSCKSFNADDVETLAQKYFENLNIDLDGRSKYIN